MEEQELADLLMRYQEGRCTEEERELLRSWYVQWNTTDPLHLSESELLGVENEIRQKVRPKRKRRIIRMLPGIAASIAVFVVLGAGAYLYLGRPGRESQQAVAANENDAAPGTNKAVLTLSNGTTIVLNDTAKGILATQGNHNVVKTDSNILAYEMADDAVGKKETATFNTLTIPRGGQYQLVLSDGTKVWLNAASSISYPAAFTGGKRSVKITGEAYFEVAHNANKPFIVEAAGEIIEVLGTHFNVYAYSDEAVVRTTLLSGSVKVALSASDHSAILRPGEQLQINESGRFNLLTDVNTDRVVAWTKGQLSLEDVDVKTLMRRLSRWYDVDIKYEGKVPQERFGGRISRNVYLSNVLSVLNANGIDARLEGKTIIVSSK